MIDCPAAGSIILDLVISKLHGKNIYAKVTKTQKSANGFSFVATNELFKIHYPHRFFKFEYGNKWVGTIDFENWFADCVIYCAKNNIGPDDYKWDLKKCDGWMEKNIARMSPGDAVSVMFNSN